MGKIRSLNQQINYAITDNCRIGESKRNYKSQHEGKTNGQVFSVQYAKNLRDTAKAFSNYMKSNHPEIRMCRDIKTEHVQGYINANSKNWSRQTIENKISQFEKIVEQINITFHSDIKLNLNQPEIIGRESVRNIAISKNDLNDLRLFFRDKTSMASRCIEITSRCGLRVEEVACLRVSDINLDKGVLELREGTKNGKWRDVPIRDKDIAYFRDLKQNATSQYVTEGVKANSLNRGIRRGMEELGISEKYKCTTNHAIRKYYATERMAEERAKGYSEKKAWEIIQKELGHGDNFRVALYTTYIK